MNLILNAHRSLKLGALLLQHHVFHKAWDFQREWGEGEVFLRCQRCGLRTPGLQIGPPRLATRLSGHPARRRVEVPA